MAEVEFEVVDGVAIMTLNRPEQRNAINAAILDGLGDGFERINSDPAIRVGILTGAGGYFCAGMDLKAFAKGERLDGRRVPFGGKDNVQVDKPMIAAVEGFAVAGGLELALTCDLIVASRAAKFGIPEVKRGLIAAGGALIKLPRMAPLNLVMEMALTGDTYPAEALYSRGVINRLTEAGGALEGAVALAKSIAENAPMAVASSKKLIRASLDWPTTEAFDLQQAITKPVMTSKDAREGATAFAEKRKPQWSGS